jgi:Domain of unknown function (DUF1707)
MSGLENETAAGGGRGRLRASHADREHVIGTLKAAYVYGLVTKDEFDARVSQTLASRTYAELALVTADIPAGLAAAQQRPRPASARGNAPAGANVRPGDRAIIATAVFAGLALVISVHADPFASLAAFLLVLGGAGSAFVSLFLLGRRIRRSRRDNRSGGQLPPQRAIHSGPGAGHRAASAASAEPLPCTSKRRRPGNADAARRHLLRPQLSS